MKGFSHAKFYITLLECDRLYMLNSLPCQKNKKKLNVKVMGLKDDILKTT